MANFLERIFRRSKPEASSSPIIEPGTGEYTDVNIDMLEVSMSLPAIEKQVTEKLEEVAKQYIDGSIQWGSVIPFYLPLNFEGVNPQIDLKQLEPLIRDKVASSIKKAFGIDDLNGDSFEIMFDGNRKRDMELLIFPLSYKSNLISKPELDDAEKAECKLLFDKLLPDAKASDYRYLVYGDAWQPRAYQLKVSSLKVLDAALELMSHEYKVKVRGFRAIPDPDIHEIMVAFSSIEEA